MRKCKGLFMDKLKIVKFAVFLMAFCIIFLLCLAVGRLISAGPAEFGTIRLHAPATARITQILADSGKLYILAGGDRVYILKNNSLEGVVYLHGDDVNGQEK